MRNTFFLHFEIGCRPHFMDTDIEFMNIALIIQKQGKIIVSENCSHILVKDAEVYFKLNFGPQIAIICVLMFK